jgi:EAL domain-containing protein (putative c-di-GMP-specific phosphodiesterase class I)
MTPNFVEHVVALIEEFSLDPATLHMELTEAIWLNSSTKALRLFKQLNGLGIHFHIDDFGTGYSSLAYLQSFPIQTIKIDRSFVSKLGSSSNSVELVRAVIVMARDLGMETVAEGVETAEQLNSLKELGCNYGQGYLFSRPVNQQEIEKLLADPLYGATTQAQLFEELELFPTTSHPSHLLPADK